MPTPPLLSSYHGGASAPSASDHNSLDCDTSNGNISTSNLLTSPANRCVVQLQPHILPMSYNSALWVPLTTTPPQQIATPYIFDCDHDVIRITTSTVPYNSASTIQLSSHSPGRLRFELWGKKELGSCNLNWIWIIKLTTIGVRNNFRSLDDLF